MDAQTLLRTLEAATLPPLPERRDWRIGCIGAVDAATLRPARIPTEMLGPFSA